MNTNKEVEFLAKCELARREFWYYCKLMAPDFYKEDREYLKNLCDELQRFVETSELQVMVVNEPPRHGKSRTATLLTNWIFGKDQTKKVMTASYNETLSTTFSKKIRNSIQEMKGDRYKPIFNDVFPGVHIKRGDAATNLWSLEGGDNNYLATSPKGTATGFGCHIMIIDDLIKSADEANNARVLEEQWSWFTDTMLSRLEQGGKIIVIMTRWHSKDLAGRILKWCEEAKKKYIHLSLKACEGKKMLCDEILSYENYIDKVKAMGEDIASANYQQEPIDLKGNLYSYFTTYEETPEFEEIKAYCDTADTGKDYLCSLVYGVRNKEAYILDVVYTQAPMEITEKAVAKSYLDNNVSLARIESNNGGRGFARQVERILNEQYASNRTKIDTFHQTKNKVSRILSNATWVMDHVKFPKNWNLKYPEYYQAMRLYQREGRNEHDDAPDATTGIAESIELKPIQVNLFKGGL